ERAREVVLLDQRVQLPLQDVAGRGGLRGGGRGQGEGGERGSGDLREHRGHPRRNRLFSDGFHPPAGRPADRSRALEIRGSAGATPPVSARRRCSAAGGGGGTPSVGGERP